MPIRGVITYQASPEHTLAVLNKSVKHALNIVGHHWHSKILPRHFETSAVAKYGYQKRTKKYQIRKARQKGHQRPLEFSGQLKEAVLRRARIISTSKRVKVHLKGPKYLWKYQANQPDKARELTATTESEVKELADVLERVTLNDLKTKPRRLRKTKRM